MFSTVADSASLKKDIRDSNYPVIEENFGYLHGGKVYFVKTSPHAADLPVSADANEITLNLDELGELQDILDQIPDSRKAQQIFNYFSGGNFINTRTGKDAMKHHQLFARVIHRPADYITNILQALEQFLQENHDKDFSLKELTVTPVRNALAHGMLGVDRLTPELTGAIKQFSDIIDGDLHDLKHGVEMRLLAASTFGRIAMSFIPRFYNARSAYLMAATQFMEDQAETILIEIQKYANNENVTNLLALAVIEMIKENNPELRNDFDALAGTIREMSLSDVQESLMHPDVITIPASVTAGDNTMTLLSCILTAFTKDKNLLQQFRDEIAAKGMLDMTDPEKIRNIIKAERYNHGFIHRVYLEGLRRQDIYKSADDLAFQTMNLRYNYNNPIDFKGITIPENSTIALLPAMPRFDARLWKDPEEFNPDRYKNNPQLEKYPLSGFSSSHRRCPASDTNEFMAVSFLAYLVTRYDIALENTESKKAAMINVRLTPRANSHVLTQEQQRVEARTLTL